MARKLASRPLRRSTTAGSAARAGALPARMPEAAQTPGAVGKVVLTGLREFRLFHRLDDQLGDAVTPFDLIRGRWDRY